MRKNGKARVYPLKSDTDCKNAGLVPTEGYRGEGASDGADGILNLARVVAKQRKTRKSKK